MTQSESNAQTYNEWRATQIHQVGQKTQMKAEAMLDRQAAEPFVEMNDEKSGRRRVYRRHIADILQQRGEASKPKTYFFMNG